MSRGCYTADLLRWWSVCIHHLPRCVNILLGSHPGISSGVTTLSPLCACQQVIQSLKFYSDKSSEQVMHCTQYDSQRCLSMQPFQQPVEAVTGPRLAALTGTCLHRVRFGTAGDSTCQVSSRPSREATCADGSWTKGWPVMSSGSF